ncbi:MAG: histidinol-phosphatase HisJ family protein [Lachnospiraceae bacterium]|nr:histidinol-phosphatase HisJ family protein [Lachnospiraceae bacterium]
MIEYDVHLHTEFSTDSEEKAETVIEKAIELGLKGICFTDHMDLYFPLECSKKSGGDFTFDLDGYFDKLDYLKRKYMGQIEILCGLEAGLRDEIDLREKCFNEYREMVTRYPFDFVIGSTHCLEDIDPYWEEYWYGRTAEEGLDRYFDAIAQNCTYYDCFDSLGHLDYLVRYVSADATIKSIKAKGLNNISGKNTEDVFSNPELLKRLYGREIYNPADFADRIDYILRKIIEKGSALEINTAGLKYGLGFAHPKREILLRYRELGGELITIGSDAHMAVHLAYDFNAACEMLKDLGFKYYFVYKDRKPAGYVL